MENQTTGNTTAPVKVVPQKHEPKFMFDIEANGVKFPIFEHTIRKGTSAGETYLAPDFEKLSLQQLDQAFGKLLMDNIVIPKLRPFAISISKEAVSEVGEDPEAVKETYSRLFSQLSQRSESIASLTDRREELSDELTELDPVTDQAKFLEVATKIKNISLAIQEKRDKSEERKAAKEAEDKAKNGSPAPAEVVTA